MVSRRNLIIGGVVVVAAGVLGPHSPETTDQIQTRRISQ